MHRLRSHAPGHGARTSTRQHLQARHAVAGRFARAADRGGGVFEACGCSTRTRRSCSCSPTRRAVGVRQGEAQLPALLAVQEAVIFRATEQWFVRVDNLDLRKRALDAIKATQWVPTGARCASPAWSRSAPTGASAGSACGESHPGVLLHRVQRGAPDRRDERHVRDVFAAKGADSWFTTEAKDLLRRGRRARLRSDGVPQGERHLRRVVRVGFVAPLRAAEEPASVSVRTVPRRHRPAPRVVPGGAADRRAADGQAPFRRSSRTGSSSTRRARDVQGRSGTSSWARSR